MTQHGCTVIRNCRNGLADRRTCVLCRFDDLDPGIENRYWPLEKAIKHPKLEAEKAAKKREKAYAQLAARQARNKGKQVLQAKARKAEAATERNIIKSTKNSGRVNCDGDHTAAGFFALDTKLQTTRETPQIKWTELQKIRSQAAANSKPVGALVVRGKSGRAVVVIDEDDFGKVLKALLR
jgi:hypothetical protein